MSQRPGSLHWSHIIHTLGPVLYSGLFTMCRVNFSFPIYAQRHLCISSPNRKICLTQTEYAYEVISIWKDNTHRIHQLLCVQYSSLVLCMFYIQSELNVNYINVSLYRYLNSISSALFSLLMLLACSGASYTYQDLLIGLSDMHDYKHRPLQGEQAKQ